MTLTSLIDPINSTHKSTFHSNAMPCFLGCLESSSPTPPRQGMLHDPAKTVLHPNLQRSAKTCRCRSDPPSPASLYNGVSAHYGRTDALLFRLQFHFYFLCHTRNAGSS